MLKKLIITAACVAMAIPSMAAIATFDWAEASNAQWWYTGGYVETDNGITMTAAGRAFTLGTGATGEGFKAQYWQDSAPSVFTFDQDVTIGSVDVKWSGDLAGVPDGWYGLYGRLDGVNQWEIIPGAGEIDTGAFNTYTAATGGDMSLQIDEIHWYSKYDSADPSAILTWDNKIDNIVVVPEPATLGLMGLAGLAIYIKRKLS